MKKIYLLILSFALVSCSTTNEDTSISQTISEDVIDESVVSKGYEGTVNGIYFNLPDLGENVKIHSSLQESYIQDEDYNSISNYANVNVEQSRPENLMIFCLTENNILNNYKIYYSEKSDLSDAIIRNSNSATFTINNLKVNTKYYWAISVDDVKSPTVCFKTSSSPIRNIYASGISNVRDIGGLPTTNNMKVKQGLIYRSPALTQNESGSAILNSDGIKQLQELNIKSEIDLRGAYDNENGGITTSIIGEDVKYYHCPMGYSDMLTRNIEQVKKVLDILADESNLPTIIHCAGGLDRTGMIAYLVNSLCFVKEEYLYKDYLFSNFGKTNDERNINHLFNSEYYKLIDANKGTNQVIKTYNTLASLGVSNETLDGIMENMIEGYTAD